MNRKKHKCYYCNIPMQQQGRSVIFLTGTTKLKCFDFKCPRCGMIHSTAKFARR